MIQKKELQKIVNRSKCLAHEFGENEKEIFTALLIKELLNSEMPAQIKAKQYKQLSAAELILQKNPKSDTELVLVIAYYLEKIKQRTSFDRKDILECISTNTIKKIKNVDEPIRRNVAKGRFTVVDHESNSKKTWTLTQTGEVFVENKLPEDV